MARSRPSATAARFALGGTKQRALLALLALRINQTVSPDRLIDELWGERPPATAPKALQVHVSRLRKSLASDVIQHTRARVRAGL